MCVLVGGLVLKEQNVPACIFGCVGEEYKSPDRKRPTSSISTPSPNSVLGILQNQEMLRGVTKDELGQPPKVCPRTGRS